MYILQCMFIIIYFYVIICSKPCMFRRPHAAGGRRGHGAQPEGAAGPPAITPNVPTKIVPARIA